MAAITDRAESMMYAALAALLLLVGCESAPTELEDYHPQPVLNLSIFNGEPVEEVYLERVASLYERYEGADHGIHNADIILYEVGGGDTLHFAEDPDYGGRYVPAAGESLTPRGLAAYRVEARTPAGEYLWAEALVPGGVEEHGPVSIFLEDGDGNRYPVADGDTLNRSMPNMVWEWADVDSAGGFQGLLVCETPRDSLVPLDPGWEQGEPEDSLEDWEKNRMGQTIMRYDQRSVKILWLAFQFVGWHRVELLAISRDYYDYMFSLFYSRQGVGSKPEYNVNGGLGVFAAVSRRGMRIYMERVGG